MSWNYPYLKNEGSCELRHKECEPLEKGCIILANASYKRLYKKNGEQAPMVVFGENSIYQNITNRTSQSDNSSLK